MMRPSLNVQFDCENAMRQRFCLTAEENQAVQNVKETNLLATNRFKCKINMVCFLVSSLLLKHGFNTSFSINKHLTSK